MAELRQTAAAGAQPRKVFVLEEPPSLPQGVAASPGRPRGDPERKIREMDPKPRAPRWWLLLLLLLLLSCLLWAVLHGLAFKNQQQMREELQLLLENNSGNWAEAWQTLTQVQWQQVELSRITELLCRSTEDTKKCPPGWQFHVNSCYYFSSLARSWDSARSFCQTFHADLVVVSTEEEQLFLVRNLQGNNTYWMGARDERHEGKWTWVSGKSPTFGFWDVWEQDPHREQKDCGAMKPNGRWIHELCSKGGPWICEKSWDCSFPPLFPPAARSVPQD
ncbi:CD209 antigen-like protein E [Chamaea fasciata]|uniref:CD209 antigen-like protein E n=1 Tax=Chamaea fasciata TaxID=190680 RepID=UPI00336A07FF